MLIDGLNDSSQEQAHGIEQISKAVGQMEQTTQNTRNRRRKRVRE